MNTLAGRSPFACRYPSRHRANSGIFSIPESTGAGIGAQNRAEDSDPEPPVPREPLVFYGMRPLRLPFAQNPVCKRPRMLNIPKNARRTLPQAPAARRRIASASPVTAGGPRAYLPNLSAGRRSPCRAKRAAGAPTCPRTIWRVTLCPADGIPKHAMLLMCSKANAAKIQSAHVV